MRVSIKEAAVLVRLSDFSFLDINYVEECRDEVTVEFKEAQQEFRRPLKIFSAVPRCHSNKVTLF